MSKLSPRQRTYIRKRTALRELDPSEEMGELNIVPFLDIVVNIIVFLLATTEAVLAVAEVDAHLPSLGRRAGRQQLQEESSGLNLSVTITPRGLIVGASGGFLVPGCRNTSTGDVLTVPRARGRYDWDGLTECVQQVKAEPQFADERQVILSADPEIEFQHLIAAMDALRGDGTDELFPDVLLSAGVR